MNCLLEEDVRDLRVDVRGLVCSRSDSWSRLHSSSLVNIVQFEVGDEEANAGIRLEERNSACPPGPVPSTCIDRLWCQNCQYESGLLACVNLWSGPPSLVEEAEQGQLCNLMDVLFSQVLFVSKIGISGGRLAMSSCSPQRPEEQKWSWSNPHSGCYEYHAAVVNDHNTIPNVSAVNEIKRTIGCAL